MVTSHNHIKEISEAPLNTLSLHAVAKDFLQPKHTMHGFEWKDQRGIEGTGFATTYAVADLYSHDEYIEPLRNEVESCSLAKFKDTAGGLPLLDSFLKESARLSTFESTSVRRQALKPFVFTDGLRISAGDWVCIPHRSMMRDNKFVDNALEFDAFRSVNSLLRDCNTSQRTKLVDTSEDWLVWGSGRTVW
ncbi:MAG: hypothetical protein LQ351_006256 [Letrouitia transgressa]|nr:MAG: hypothetical protein LQ351_006256 [Letrouitia transgressa]